MRLQAPIVLAHGLFGFTRIGVGPYTLVWYFRDIPRYLASLGHRVLVTRVHPTAGIELRAGRLARRIETAFGDEPVHIVAHSMGGLDARLLLTDRTWARRALSLTTIATPHLGTALADIAKGKLGWVYRVLDALGLNHNGFIDVTRRKARAFHRSTPKPDGVACFSIAGDPSFDDVSWPLQHLYETLWNVEGPNDGLVSVDSAYAFGERLPFWPIDHLAQMNWMFPGRRSLRAEFPLVHHLYSEVLQNLARRGFAVADDSARFLRPRFDANAPKFDDFLIDSYEDPVLDVSRTIRLDGDSNRIGSTRFGVRVERIGSSLLWRPCGEIEKNGDRHVSQHVGNRPTTVEEPIDRQKQGNFIGREVDRGEDQRQRDETSRRDPAGADACDQSCNHNEDLIKSREWEIESLRQEEDRGSLVQSGAVVVEVGADAGGEPA